MKLKTGTLLQGGKYRIEKVLGQGGFGITYLAQQVGLGRSVALKEFFMKEHCERDNVTLHVTLGTSGSKDLVEKFRKKFIKEAQIISELDNKHIIQIYDIFEENGTAYYVMKYVDGGSLNDLVISQGAIAQDKAVCYIRQVADALNYIHERNLLHLDVKPSNILLQNDQAVLVDFGLSKHYDDDGGQTSSTPVGISKGYTPLEQYNQDISKFTPAADVYSLAATLLRLLTGSVPPDAASLINDGLPTYPALSHEMTEVIMKGMASRCKDRPQSVSEFISLLDSVPSVTEAIDNKTDEDLATEIVGQDSLVEPDNPKDKTKDSSGTRYLTVTVLILSILLLIWMFLDISVFKHFQSPRYPHFLFLIESVLVLAGSVWAVLKIETRFKWLKRIAGILLISAEIYCLSYLEYEESGYYSYNKSIDAYKCYDSFFDGLTDSDYDWFGPREGFEKYIVTYKWGKAGIINGVTGEVIVPHEYEMIRNIDLKQIDWNQPAYNRGSRWVAAIYNGTRYYLDSANGFIRVSVSEKAGSDWQVEKTPVR